jgi:hydroxymethylbilane synthase
MGAQVRIRLATRRSQLAMTQSRWVGAQLCQHNPNIDVELVEVVTRGDLEQSRPLREIGGKALFVREIEEALLDNRADIAVHSLKDLPIELPPGLCLLAVPEREDPRDALITKSHLNDISELPIGARIGTSSLRRQALLLRQRPDLQIEPLRGNVDTRLGKLKIGDLDGIVLAQAGLNRLGVRDIHNLLLEPHMFVPAGCQGALGIESRNDSEFSWIKTHLDHTPTHLAVCAERAFLRLVEGSCQVPVGAFGHWIDGTLQLTGMVADEGGDVIQITLDRTVETVSDGISLGEALAKRIKLAGGTTIIRHYLGVSFEHPTSDSTQPKGEVLAPSYIEGRRVLLTRSSHQQENMDQLLRRYGALPVHCPTIQYLPLAGAERAALLEAVQSLMRTDWALFTSANAVRAIGSVVDLQNPEVSSQLSQSSIFAIGGATAKALKEVGLVPSKVAKMSDSEGVVDALAECVAQHERVVHFMARETRPVIERGLRRLDIPLQQVVAYETAAPSGLPERVCQLNMENLDFVTLASPRTAHHLWEAAGELQDQLRCIPVGCIGPVTRRSAAELGFNVVVQPLKPGSEALIASINSWFQLVK